jgi:hypothetical protein
MRVLWIMLSLSISRVGVRGEFVAHPPVSNTYQAATVPTVGQETLQLVDTQDWRQRALQSECYRFVKDASGFDILELVNNGTTCGWVDLQVLTASDFKGGGWNGFIKLVDADHPNNKRTVLYLGSVYTTRQLNFQGINRIACYRCQGPTNCNPYAENNDCFVPGPNQITCDKRIDCSSVLRVNQCYRANDPNDAQAPQFYFNDLGFCKIFPQNLQNYSGAGFNTFQQIESSSQKVPTPDYQPALKSDVIVTIAPTNLPSSVGEPEPGSSVIGSIARQEVSAGSLSVAEQIKKS